MEMFFLILIGNHGNEVPKAVLFNDSNIFFMRVDFGNREKQREFFIENKKKIEKFDFEEALF